jgi:hypothetical protein
MTIITATIRRVLGTNEGEGLLRYGVGRINYGLLEIEPPNLFLAAQSTRRFTPARLLSVLPDWVPKVKIFCIV